MYMSLYLYTLLYDIIRYSNIFIGSEMPRSPALRTEAELGRDHHPPELPWLHP